MRGWEFIGAQTFDSKFWGRHKKAARRSVPLKTAKSRLRRIRPGYFPCFAYQSALIGVKLFHFSGRSSSATIDAFGRVDVQLRLTLERRFVLARMNTVHRADIHARGVFCADTRLGN